MIKACRELTRPSVYKPIRKLITITLGYPCIGPPMVYTYRSLRRRSFVRTVLNHVITY